MHAIAMETGTGICALKDRLKTTWRTGDYEGFSGYLQKDAERFFLRLRLTPGTKLLDVGCGAGQLALIAARAGLEVTGCDIAYNWIEKARARAKDQGLSVAFDEGDAESLPYPDASFDVVASLIGAMFGPRPELVAAEMTRVCRPGGIIAMANWTPGGFIGQMFKTIARHIAPAGMPAPVLWGDEDIVRERFRKGIAELRLTRHFYNFEYPFSPSGVVDFFRENYGPMARAFTALDSDGRRTLRDELIRLWSAHNQSDGGRTRVDAEYLQVVAVTQAPGLH